MKKIIAAIDGLKISESTKEYAIEIAKHSNTHLVGVFLDDQNYHSYKIHDLITDKGISDQKLKLSQEKDRKTRDAAVQYFETACRASGINYGVHHDKHTALQELLHESIYADLLVIDGKETFSHFSEPLPTKFIRDLLGNSQCPVLVTPAKYKPIEKVVLLFDGKPSSVHAIKMFSYMLSSLKHLPAEVVTVKRIAKDLHLPDNRLMKEFMKRHFPKATYKVLRGLAEIEIIKYLKSTPESTLIVLGAYRRGNMSRWFNPSMADLLIKEIKAPLFIAHSK